MNEINVPEQLPDYNSPGYRGTWNQLFSINFGRKVKIEITMTDGTLRAISGELYMVGLSYVGVMCGDRVCLADLYSIKFVTFC